MYSEKDSLVVMAIPLEIRVEKHKEFNIKTHTAFVDFERAFDRVNRRKLLEILASDGVPHQIIKVYIMYITETKSQ